MRAIYRVAPESSETCQHVGVSDDLRDGDTGDRETEIAYDLSGWAAGRREELGRLLDSRGIPHAFDGDELVVDPADEDEVDGVVAGVPCLGVRLSAGPERGPVTDRGEVSYDCSPWAGETRRLLGSLLETRAIPHAWEGTVLVVRADREAEVDELVDEMAATAVASLEEGAPTAAYEMGAWSAESQNALVAALGSEAIPHEWDAEGDLVVHERDAERTEELIESLGEPDGGDAMDGLELHERLDSLFVAADRLAGNPDDRAGARDAVAATEALRPAAVPFGVEAGQWRRLIGRADALVAALRAEHDGEPGDDEPGDDGDVAAAARVVRDLLRQFV